jgi:DNA topoisomerase-3
MIKVTDHHAIIPQFSLTYTINSRYMTLLQSGLLLFYDDCSVANTTVIGKAADVAFKTTGNFTKGWRILRIPTQRKKEADLLPDFIKGEKDTPTLVLEKTKAQISSEATLWGHGNRRKTGGR